MSYAEELFKRSLKLVLSDNEIIKQNFRPFWLLNKKTGSNLEYDFYIPRLRIAFEIQGQHHYDNFYQRFKDNLKKELSEKENIILFQVSIFQLSPSTIRRKLVNYSFKVQRNFNLKPFNKEQYDALNCEIKKYRLNIQEKYGYNDCQKTPHAYDTKLRNNKIDAFLKSHKCFYLNLKNKNTCCRYVSHTKYKIVVEIAPGVIRNLKYSYFLPLIN
jgi:hypothetical protein